MWETLRAPAPAVDPVGEGEGEGAEGEGAKVEAPAEAPASADAQSPEGVTPEGWPLGTVPEPAPKITPDELAEFVFEMNDWLVEWMEVWDGDEVAFPDERGRFHSRKVDFGSPHASATGVYIEGLIDAYEMAKTLGDTKRKKRYALALSRGIRSVMQLQFVDDIDMYYVRDRDQTKGGLRTTVMRNEVRVDNVQHVLMGVIKVLDRFSPEEFNTEG